MKELEEGEIEDEVLIHKVSSYSSCSENKFKVKENKIVKQGSNNMTHEINETFTRTDNKNGRNSFLCKTFFNNASLCAKQKFMPPVRKEPSIIRAAPLQILHNDRINKKPQIKKFLHVKKYNKLQDNRPANSLIKGIPSLLDLNIELPEKLKKFLSRYNDKKKLNDENQDIDIYLNCEQIISPAKQNQQDNVHIKKVTVVSDLELFTPYEEKSEIDTDDEDDSKLYIDETVVST